MEGRKGGSSGKVEKRMGRVKRGAGMLPPIVLALSLSFLPTPSLSIPIASPYIAGSERSLSPSLPLLTAP
jgi:hypothetical protein